MKGKTVILIAGSALVVGAIVYGLYNCFQKHKRITVDTQYAPNDNRDHTFTSETACDDTPLVENIVINFEQTQQDTMASIRKHHQEAVHQLEDTLNDIMRDSDEFEEKINQVNDDLGELIK